MSGRRSADLGTKSISAISTRGFVRLESFPPIGAVTQPHLGYGRGLGYGVDASALVGVEAPIRSPATTPTRPAARRRRPSEDYVDIVAGATLRDWARRGLIKPADGTRRRRCGGARICSSQPASPSRGAPSHDTPATAGAHALSRREHDPLLQVTPARDPVGGLAISSRAARADFGQLAGQCLPRIGPAERQTIQVRTRGRCQILPLGTLWCHLLPARLGDNWVT
jgi:hypothetical protein